MSDDAIQAAWEEVQDAVTDFTDEHFPGMVSVADLEDRAVAAATLADAARRLERACDNAFAEAT